jgi:hypothetical protein
LFTPVTAAPLKAEMARSGPPMPQPMSTTCKNTPGVSVAAALQPTASRSGTQRAIAVPPAPLRPVGTPAGERGLRGASQGAAKSL